MERKSANADISEETTKVITLSYPIPHYPI